MRIHKYTLPKPEEGENTVKVEMPEGAEVQCVKMHGGKIRVFALVDPEAPAKDCTFEVWPTGVEIPGVEEKEYHLTFFGHDAKAFHLYQKMG